MPRRSWANKGCANHTMQTFISKSKPWIKTSTRKERDVTGKLRLFASTSAVCSDRTLSKPNAIRQLSKLVFSYKITQHRRDVEQTEEGTWRNVRARVFWGFSRDRITCKKKKKKNQYAELLFWYSLRGCGQTPIRFGPRFHLWPRWGPLTAFIQLRLSSGGRPGSSHLLLC